MKASDVIKILAASLPAETDVFSVTKDITSLTWATGQVTAVTSTPHGLTTGDSVTISGAMVQNSITSLTSTFGVASATTALPHDLTLGYQKEVNISGADDANYNGAHKLLSVPNRNTFTYAIAGTPTSPDIGAPVLLEDRSIGYNGRFTINVMDSTTFSYPVATALPSPAVGGKAHTEIRISGAITIDRAIEGYTNQNTGNLWGFVVLEDTDISRDRAIQDDAVAIHTNTQERRLRQLENFSVYVFVPTSGSIAALEERDSVDDIMVALYKSIVGTIIPSNLASERIYGIVPNGDELFAYENAFFIHRFIFQTVRDILGEDMATPKDDVAFRDIEINSLNSFSEILTSVTMDLDEEPTTP